MPEPVSEEFLDELEITRNEMHREAQALYEKWQNLQLQVRIMTVELERQGRR